MKDQWAVETQAGEEEFVPQVRSVQNTKPQKTPAQGVSIRVVANAVSAMVKVSFDPVAAEKKAKTAELNRAIRAGYYPPATSTHAK